jgi:hypothetical protein
MRKIHEKEKKDLADEKLFLSHLFLFVELPFLFSVAFLLLFVC